MLDLPTTEELEMVISQEDRKEAKDDENENIDMTIPPYRNEQMLKKTEDTESLIVPPNINENDE